MDDRSLNDLLEKWKAPDAPQGLTPRRTRRSPVEWLLTGSIRVPVPAGLAALALVAARLLSVAPEAASPPLGAESTSPNEAAVTRPSGELARHALTGSLEGLDAVLVGLTIPPGVSLPEHSHPGFVLGYIADGAATSGVDYESAEVVESGGTFFEPEGSIHSTFGAASADEAAHALVFMVVPTDTPLTDTNVTRPTPEDPPPMSPIRGDSELPFGR